MAVVTGSKYKPLDSTYEQALDKDRAVPEKGKTQVDAQTSIPRKLILVGNPNVGKSVMFYNLTGRYVTVSNYPGTTIEVTQGQARIADRLYQVYDTPGIYSMTPITDEERVARHIILDGQGGVVLHMVDAKNLERMLPLTLQLRDLGLPLILVLNMIDEVEHLGMRIDIPALSKKLGIPVVETVAVSRRGMSGLKEALATFSEGHWQKESPLRYNPLVEETLHKIAERLPDELQPIARGIGLLLLQRDQEIKDLLETKDPQAAQEIAELLHHASPRRGTPLYFTMAMARQAYCRNLIEEHVVYPERPKLQLADRLSEWTINPWTGIPILFLVLYIGLYKIVGELGAGVLVELIEQKLFGAHLIPWLEKVMQKLLPLATGWQYWTRELFLGRYGIISMGISYALAIVLPIVTMFFLFFSVLEDSGYFPRLAMLVDRLFKRIGLNGRAVIPFVLGFGCGTMATMVTRIQETKRERLITIFLLALAIPCSAQFGVIAGLLAKNRPGILGISYPFLAWVAIFMGVFLVAGYILTKLLRGDSNASFYMELPVLRLPHFNHVIVKTAARVKWYLVEVIPLFIFASFVIWVGRLIGFFDLLISGMRQLVLVIGLPAAAGEVFLYGFFRRDLGAAELYRLEAAGQLSGAQLLIAGVTLTLFMPCVAQFLIMKKECGLKLAAGMALVICCVAFLAGGLLHALLEISGLSF